jgi:putative SOS response-associated peptidase YedK
VTEFDEWTPERHDVGGGKKPIEGEMWFSVTDQPIFAVAGFHQRIGDAKLGNGNLRTERSGRADPPQGDDYDFA